MNLSPLANGGGGEFSLSVVRVGRNMFLGQDRGARGCFKLYMFDGAERLKKLTTNVSGVMAGGLRSRASQQACLDPVIPLGEVIPASISCQCNGLAVRCLGVPPRRRISQSEGFACRRGVTRYLSAAKMGGGLVAGML